MGALEQGQAAIGRRMVDTCLITRGSGAPVFNEDTGRYDDTDQLTLYSGRCRVGSTTGLSATERSAGDRFLVANRVTVSVPMGTTGLAKDDLVTITAAAFNPQLAGARYIVRSVDDMSEATAVRLQCEETP